MGSYAVLSIDGFEIASDKNDVDPTVIALFQEADKQIYERADMEETIEAPSDEETDDWDDDWEEEPTTIVQYVTTIKVVRDRLEVMGFSLPVVQEAFCEGLEESRAYLIKLIEQMPVLRDSLTQEDDLLRALTLESWLDGFTYIVKAKLRYSYSRQDLDQYPPLIQYMLKSRRNDFFGFPVNDFRVFMRAIVDIFDLTAPVVYDLTDVVAGGYIDIDDDLSAYSRRMLAEDFLINQRIVVLTEGSSDKHALEASLRLLYPHVANYYSFMDFEGTKAPGGASALVATLKAFIGAGIANRIVALFDNDTAAQSALRGLRGIKVPSNVRILRYPDVDFARNYPTLGPTGLISMDVNGLAGGLELYFGLDALRSDDGNFTPIQWRGYDDAMKQYQGELLNKRAVQERFVEKLRRCQENPAAIESSDWDGMRAILDHLRRAFTD